MLPEDASQADVYQAAVRSIVDDVMQGFNGTVMAYGQVRAPARDLLAAPGLGTCAGYRGLAPADALSGMLHPIGRASACVHACATCSLAGQACV